ncbi:MAG: hypothetical protein JW862_01665 [Anaerolineales bacterium]|nr:hypothetical protein [Anaerolineales bacterium]
MSDIRITTNFGSFQAQVETALAEIEHAQIIERIWQHDHSVWKPEPTEISNRLGWLRIAEKMQAEVDRLESFARLVQQDGFTQVLLLGMGGSSLAPEVLRKTFGLKPGYLDLHILDSTDPDVILAYQRDLDLRKTLFIVSTKSGGTVETASFFKYFYQQVTELVGPQNCGQHFVAITDPGSTLVDLAHQHDFRDLFLNDPTIGGRFSALSFFGLVPAALLGVDLNKLLEHAIQMAELCKPENPANKNPGALLGSLMGEMAKLGHDKVTFVISNAYASFGDWVEQLIAESTGKEGNGILPVVGEPLGEVQVYGQDRVFVQLKQSGDDTYKAALRALEEAGYPVMQFQLRDAYDLGGQFFLWEFATAIAGYRLGINPFDQPDVESAKVLARKQVAAFQQSGQLPAIESATLQASELDAFLRQAQPGDYIALQAYCAQDQQTNAVLQYLRLKLRDHYRLATTLGFGPRFLHSTGQLHKGDGGNGLFIQFICRAKQDADIPDQVGSAESGISFETLKLAQALGDGEALVQAGRRFIRFRIDTGPVAVIQSLANPAQQG